MGGSSKTTSSTNVDPQLLKLYQDNYSNANGVADQLAQPYTGQLVAPLNSMQTQAQGIFSNFANDTSGQDALNSATSAVRGVLSGDPLSSANLAKYQNPFQSDVINQSILQNEHARQIAGVADNQHATQANAFGGTRQAVQGALTNEAYDRNNQINIAGLNSQNFAQSQQAALAAAGLTLNSAGQIVSLNNARLGDVATRGGLLGAAGDAQQQNDQALNSANYQEWLRQLTQPQQMRNQALTMIPMAQTQTNVSKENPGLGGILGGLGSIASIAATPFTGGLLSGLLGAPGIAAGTIGGYATPAVAGQGLLGVFHP